MRKKIIEVGMEFGRDWAGRSKGAIPTKSTTKRPSVCATLYFCDEYRDLKCDKKPELSREALAQVTYADVVRVWAQIMR